MNRRVGARGLQKGRRFRNWELETKNWRLPLSPSLLTSAATDWELASGNGELRDQTPFNSPVLSPS